MEEPRLVIAKMLRDDPEYNQATEDFVNWKITHDEYYTIWNRRLLVIMDNLRNIVRHKNGQTKLS